MLSSLVIASKKGKTVFNNKREPHLQMLKGMDTEVEVSGTLAVWGHRGNVGQRFVEINMLLRSANTKLNESKGFYTCIINRASWG